MNFIGTLTRFPVLAGIFPGKIAFGEIGTASLGTSIILPIREGLG